MFLLVPCVHHMAPLGGLVDHGPEKYWMNPFLALIMFDLGLALEVLQFATLLVVVVFHPAVVAATGKLSHKLR